MSRPVGARNGHALNKGQSGKPLAGASKKLKAMPFIRGKAPTYVSLWCNHGFKDCMIYEALKGRPNLRTYIDHAKQHHIRGKAPTDVSLWCNHGLKDCMISVALKGRPNLRTYIDHAKQHHITWQGCNFSAE